ncbi:MAG TPA: ATP-binding protein [Gammaproteobacteria bacterium]
MNELEGPHPLHRASARIGGLSKRFEPLHRVPRSLRTGLAAAAVCTAAVGVALAIGLTVQHFLAVPNVLLVFLPVVLFAAVRYGFVASSLTSLLSVAATSYFSDPAYSFELSDRGNLWALLMFMLVAAYTSNLAAKIQQRAAAERRHSRLIEQLYQLSSRLAALSGVDELAVEAAKQVHSMLRADAVVLTHENGALRPRSPSALIPPGELLAATWCYEQGRPAGSGTPVFSGASHRYLPLDTGRGTVGVLGLRRSKSDPPLTADETRLLEALCHQVAMSLDRAKLADEMHSAMMLAETEKLRTALLTSISHDLKTPLASILGNVSSLRQYWPLYDEATRAEMLANAEDETLRLGQFVENLLQMTRIDAGALRPNIEDVDVSDLIGSALQRTEKQTAGHVVRTELPEELPMVPLDFVLAEHVLVNLLDNAAKYSPQGSPIEVAVADDGDELRLTVTDCGPGIPEEDLERIFERFFRARVADHRRAGAGLGLAICKGFVEAMGGKISARNRTDRSGAVFTVAVAKTRGERRR